MMENVKVSVIIPVYNTEQYIDECLNSIENQTLKEIEIICVDDRGDDKAISRVHEHMNDCPSIKCLEMGKNSGQAAARNKGFEKAVGKYVYFVDSDDYLARDDALELLYDIAEKYSSDCVCFDAEVKYDDLEVENKKINEISEGVPNGNYSGIEFFKRYMKKGEYSVGVWRQFWKREYLLKNNISFCEKTSPHEDLPFTINAVIPASIISHIEDRLYVYRVRAGSSMTAKPSLNRIRAYFECYCELYRFIGRFSVYEDIAEEIFEYFSHCERRISELIPELIKTGIDVNKYICSSLETRLCFMSIFPFLNRWISPEEYGRLKAAKQIIIYGTSGMSADVCKMMKMLGLFNLIYTQSDTSNAHERGAVPLNNITISTSTVCVVAASRVHHKDISMIMKNKGVTDFVFLN